MERITMSAEVMLSWVFKGLVSAFLSWLWYGKTRLDKRIDELTNKAAITPTTEEVDKRIEKVAGSLDKRVSELSNKSNMTPTSDEVDKRIDRATTALQNNFEKDLDAIKEYQKEMMDSIRRMSDSVEKLAREQAVTNERWRSNNAKSKGSDN